jgi:uncharacterized phage-associated protein
MKSETVRDCMGLHTQTNRNMKKWFMHEKANDENFLRSYSVFTLLYFAFGEKIFLSSCKQFSNKKTRTTLDDKITFVTI